jgi:hypothetical protein
MGDDFIVAHHAGAPSTRCHPAISNPALFSLLTTAVRSGPMQMERPD